MLSKQDVVSSFRRLLSAFGSKQPQINDLQGAKDRYILVLVWLSGVRPQDFMGPPFLQGTIADHYTKVLAGAFPSF